MAFGLGIWLSRFALPAQGPLTLNVKVPTPNKLVIFTLNKLRKNYL